jgi:hypothetical protein
MGLWGYGIFENDDACDVRDLFHQMLKQGKNILEATQTCVARWPECLQDFNAVLAIAALQLERNSLQPEIKKLCLLGIEENKEVSSWNDPGKRMKEL